MLENRAQVCTSSYTAADKYFETWQELTRQMLSCLVEQLPCLHDRVQ